VIDLAPNHKLGLIVPNPIMIAGGMIGYGEAMHNGLVLEVLGGVVIGPLLLNSRRARETPRLAALNGGFVLQAGLQNRGLNAVLRQFAPLWPRIGCPVIAQLADTQPSALAQVAKRLSQVDGISAFEVLAPIGSTGEGVGALVRAVTRVSDLPVWVKLPLDQAPDLAPGVVGAGAVGLVIGLPPLGAGYAQALHPGQTPEDARQARMIKGALFGPLTFASMLAALAAVAALQLHCALIACGGIHTAAQVQESLDAGAYAVQIDSAMWVEPGLPARLVSELGRHTTSSESGFAGF
jgi:dihydroorotate dehydrogenase (NAD+) catalytic subunit